MSQAFKCDNCRKLFEEQFELETEVKIGGDKYIGVVSIYSEGDGKRETYPDFCGECLEKIGKSVAGRILAGKWRLKTWWKVGLPFTTDSTTDSTTKGEWDG